MCQVSTICKVRAFFDVNPTLNVRAVLAVNPFLNKRVRHHANSTVVGASQDSEENLV